MKIALFGATGLVGCSILARMLERRWFVRAIARRVDALPPHALLQTAGVDLNSADGMPDLSGMDAVVWATGNTGDIPGGLARFVRAIDSISEAGIKRLILIGSLSVLNYTDVAEGSLLDERSKTETDFRARDAYARIKWAEEELARRWVSDHRGMLTILRLGAVIGPGRAWTARLGFRIGRRWVQVLGEGDLPVVHVDDAGEAVASVLADPDAPPLLHIIHGQPPCRGEYVEAVSARGLLARPRWAVSATGLRRVVVASRRLSPLSLRRFDARFRAVRFAGTLARPYMPTTSVQPLRELVERCAIGNAG